MSSNRAEEDNSKIFSHLILALQRLISCRLIHPGSYSIIIIREFNAHVMQTWASRPIRSIHQPALRTGSRCELHCLQWRTLIDILPRPPNDHLTMRIRCQFHHLGLPALRLLIAINLNHMQPRQSRLEGQQKPKTIAEYRIFGM
jgi:hypothetical protein